MTQYVKHISGQGATYEIAIEQDAHGTWKTCAKGFGYLYLPKADYQLVSPPKKWVDVTQLVHFNEYGTLVLAGGHTKLMSGFTMAGGYRLRVLSGKDLRSRDLAYIVEQEVEDL